VSRIQGPEDKVVLRHLGARRLSLWAVRLLIGAGLVLLSWPLAAPLADQYRAQEAYRKVSACPPGEVRTASGADCVRITVGDHTEKLDPPFGFRALWGEWGKYGSLLGAFGPGEGWTILIPLSLAAMAVFFTVTVVREELRENA
jgi:hypothetical protein